MWKVPKKCEKVPRRFCPLLLPFSFSLILACSSPVLPRFFAGCPRDGFSKGKENHQKERFVFFLRTRKVLWGKKGKKHSKKKQFLLGVFQRPPTLILLQKYRDTNGRRIVIQIGGVHTTFCQVEGILCNSIAIEMGGVSRYFSKVSGSGVDSTLLILERKKARRLG